MANRPPDIPALFINRFQVDRSTPFRRYLNRLEVEIGREDYRHLKRVEMLPESPTEARFEEMEEITSRLIDTTQNDYNRNLLQRLGIRVYLDVPRYAVYYRLADRTLRFTALWRQKVLRRFFGSAPIEDTDWQDAAPALSGFQARFLPDRCGGVLLLRHGSETSPLLTATHGAYDPHSLDVALFFLRTGKGASAVINLGFSGREPLTDENLEKLKRWGVPLNPSNIDVIYPYVDASGHPYCYKLEEGLAHYVNLLGGARPELILDIHGCVGTDPEDVRLLVGLGGHPPYCRLSELGRSERHGDIVHLVPEALLRRGLNLLRDLSEEICVQFCETSSHCYQLYVLGGLQLMGRHLDPSRDVESLLPGEERTYLPADNIRWLPGARGNALQRVEAGKIRSDLRCLHVEIPTAVRRRIALKLREMEITDSLEASGL